MNGLKTDTIINRDALYALRELPEESVHCCVTSPVSYTHLDVYKRQDLMSMDELAVMDGGKCLLQVRGVRPFLSKKYDICLLYTSRCV